VTEALQDRAVQGIVRVAAETFHIQRGILPCTNDDRPWSLSTPEVEAWLRTIRRHQACSFEDVGKVRVGIKTTADEVFIRHDWDGLPANMRPEAGLLRPLLTHTNAERWLPDRAIEKKKVLYPHTVRHGKRAAVDLAIYPKAAAYLQGHQERLTRRKYVADAGRQWYEIWVPHNPADLKRRKLVFPDIAELPRFFLDTTGAIVNGDCYWITVKDDTRPDWLLLMLAVANSSFGVKYYDALFHNKLYAGRRRFMTQYVNRFPLPPLDNMHAQRILQLLSGLAREIKMSKQQEDEVDERVWLAFGLTQDQGTG
jgi:adenine-specific DNA-methyltransferase